MAAVTAGTGCHPRNWFELPSTAGRLSPSAAVCPRFRRALQDVWIALV